MGGSSLPVLLVATGRPAVIGCGLVVALLGFGLGCVKPLSLDGFACDNGRCAEGYECRPSDNVCIDVLERGCDAGQVCWSTTGAGDACLVEGAFLPCADVEDCSQGCRFCENREWSACSGGDCMPDGNGEVCDGIDNDCDGRVDNVSLLEVALYCAGQVPSTQPNGAQVAEWACTGACVVITCATGYLDLDGDEGTGCEYACTPTANSTETCDGADNDCNGSTDDIADVDADCRATLGNPPQVATVVCTATGCDIGDCSPGWLRSGTDPSVGCDIACNISNGGNEKCDGIDNDCNGVIDDGFGVGSPCGFGACAGGSHECTPNEQATRCDTMPGGSTPQNSAEICDGIDNNCNGPVDEIFDVGDPCGTGACSGGTKECLPNGSDTRCDTMSGGSGDLSAVERCDATDLDCDGDPYNGFNIGGGCGVGDCSGGVFECLADGSGAVCDVMPGGTSDQSSTEVCDGNDNDCNGTPDDAVAGAAGCVNFYRDDDGDTYGVTADMQCLCVAAGAYTATTGGDCDDSTSTCGAACNPGLIELFDDKDNNCDGNIDECLADCNCASADLVGCYEFEGNGNDSSTYGNDASTVTNIAYPTGMVGTAAGISSGASSSNLRVPDSASLDITGGITWEAWFKPALVVASRTGRVCIVDNNGQYGMFIYPGGDIRCGTGAWVAAGAGTAASGVWQHVACVYDGSTTFSVYVDGVFVASIPYTAAVGTADTQDMTIGLNSPSGDVFDGAIDNVRIWNVALTPAEIDAVGVDRR